MFVEAQHFNSEGGLYSWEWILLSGQDVGMSGVGSRGMQPVWTGDWVGWVAQSPAAGCTELHVCMCVSVCVYVYIDRYITDSLLPSSPRPFIPSCQCSFARLLSVCLILQHCILLTKERCLQHHRKCCPGRGVFKFLLVFLEEKQCWKQRIFKS